MGTGSRNVYILSGVSFKSSVSLTPQVSLLQHQKRALAWLLWRESQRPCGGILGEQQNGKVDFVGLICGSRVLHVIYLDANYWLFCRHVKRACFLALLRSTSINQLLNHTLKFSPVCF